MAAKFIAAIRQSHPNDARFLARELRQRDRDEVLASAGSHVEGAIRAAIIASGAMCWTVCNRAEAFLPVWVIGCAPVEGVPGLGSPWLLATDEVARCPGALTKLTKGHIAQMLGTYSALYNYVDARNTDSVRWLERIGFTVEPAEPYGVAGLPFHPFKMGNI